MYFLTRSTGTMLNNIFTRESEVIAIAKATEFTFENGMPEHDPGAWSVTGDSRQDALERLIKMLLENQVFCTCAPPIDWYPTDQEIITHCYSCKKPLLDNMHKAELS